MENFSSARHRVHDTQHGLCWQRPGDAAQGGRILGQRSPELQHHEVLTRGGGVPVPPPSPRPRPPLMLWSQDDL